MKQYQVGWVVQGTCYNDLILYNDEQIEIRFPMMKPKEVQLKTFYSDMRMILSSGLLVAKQMQKLSRKT